MRKSTTYHSHSPDQSLDSKSDNSGEQEERGDQDVEQRQSCEGLRGTGTSFTEEGMRHKCLQDTNHPRSRSATDIHKAFYG